MKRSPDTRELQFVGPTRRFYEGLGYVDPEQKVTVPEEMAVRLLPDKRWKDLTGTGEAAKQADDKEAS